jgi:hypothetical protein
MSLVICQFSKRAIKLTVVIIEACHLYGQYNILLSIRVSVLSEYVDVIIGDQLCEFRHNRSTTNQICCTREILGRKWEYNEIVHELFVDFKNTYDLAGRKVLYNILIVVGYP